jgi:hypothetical protein
VYLKASSAMTVVYSTTKHMKTSAQMATATIILEFLSIFVEASPESLAS